MSPFDWQEYKDFADVLYAEKDSTQMSVISAETIYRNIISRSYYAAHNQVRSKLALQESHTALINFLATSHRTLANRLKALRIERNKADYDNKYSGNLEQSVSRVLKLSKKVLDDTRNI